MKTASEALDIGMAEILGIIFICSIYSNNYSIYLPRLG